MRKAFNDYALVVIDNKFIGVSLGYDFTAEHEWGIKGIMRDCGIPEGTKKNIGVECRSITKKPNLHFEEGVYKGVKHAIMFSYCKYSSSDEIHTPRDFENYYKSLKDSIDRVYAENKLIKLSNEKNDKKEELLDVRDPIMTAWDEGNFGVAVYGDKVVQYLKELYEAFDSNNITIASMNSSSMFANTSLGLYIKDRIPEEVKEDMRLADKEYYDREDYEKKIGMKKIIKKHGNKNGYHGKNYFLACSPKWICYDDEVKREKMKAKYKTKYDIIYWVNYSDDDNNYGHYSVEEIREWLTTNQKLVEIRKA